MRCSSALKSDSHRDRIEIIILQNSGGILGWGGGGGGDNFNKCVSTVASLLHRFNFKPLQSLWTFVSGQDFLVCPPTGYGKSLVYPVLAEIAFAVGH